MHPKTYILTITVTGTAPHARKQLRDTISELQADLIRPPYRLLDGDSSGWDETTKTGWDLTVQDE
jgi:hypothetical protein